MYPGWSRQVDGGTDSLLQVIGSFCCLAVEEAIGLVSS